MLLTGVFCELQKVFFNFLEERLIWGEGRVVLGPRIVSLWHKLHSHSWWHVLVEIEKDKLMISNRGRYSNSTHRLCVSSYFTWRIILWKASSILTFLTLHEFDVNMHLLTLWSRFPSYQVHGGTLAVNSTGSPLGRLRGKVLACKVRAAQYPYGYSEHRFLGALSIS